MKFVEVKEVPRKISHNTLRIKWDEFMAMNVKVAMVNLDKNEYKSIDTARETMAMSVKRYGYPITVTKRGDEIYLIRKDM